MVVLAKASLTLKTMEWVSRMLAKAWVLEAILEDELERASSSTIDLKIGTALVMLSLLNCVSASTQLV